MKTQVPLDRNDAAQAVAPQPRSLRIRPVTSDLTCKRLAIVNVAFYGKAGAGVVNGC